VAESLAKGVRLDQNERAINVVHPQLPLKMFVGFTAVKAPDRKLKQELRSAVRPV
jgi:hypothetical protein